MLLGGGKVKGLSKELIEVIAEAVVAQQEKSMQQSKKKTRDRRLRNTNLLLKNYRMLTKHCEHILVEIEEYEDIVFDPNDLQIHALMKYKAKTKKMLAYFDAVFRSYKQYCAVSGIAAKRRADVIERKYINPKNQTAEEIAEYYDLEKRTVFRDINKATDELSVFLFGIDSLEDLEGMNN